jgi:hypothetical protein
MTPSAPALASVPGRRHIPDARPTPTRAFSADRLAPWDGEVGRSHRRPEADSSDEAA